MKIAVVFSMVFVAAGAILLSLRLLYALRRYAVAIRHCGAHLAIALIAYAGHRLLGEKRREALHAKPACCCTRSVESPNDVATRRLVFEGAIVGHTPSLADLAVWEIGFAT